METKILELIPENLRESLIEEVAELLKERADKAAKVPPTKEEIEAVINNII
ncbi:MAG: hypothetical protein ABIP35_04440 [Ginsengibacter sp.]